MSNSTGAFEQGIGSQVVFVKWRNCVQAILHYDVLVRVRSRLCCVRDICDKTYRDGSTVTHTRAERHSNTGADGDENASADNTVNYDTYHGANANA